MPMWSRLKCLGRLLRHANVLSHSGQGKRAEPGPLPLGSADFRTDGVLGVDDEWGVEAASPPAPPPPAAAAVGVGGGSGLGTGRADGCCGKNGDCVCMALFAMAAAVVIERPIADVGEYMLVEAP